MVTLSHCPVSESTNSKPTSPSGRQSELRESAAALATAPTRSSASAAQKRRLVSVDADIFDPVVLNGPQHVALKAQRVQIRRGRRLGRVRASRGRHHGREADTSSPRSVLLPGCLVELFGGLPLRAVFHGVADRFSASFRCVKQRNRRPYAPS